jgi:hypothetical protein
VSLRTTVAAPFRHMRKDSLRKSEFIFFVAIEKKWLNKDAAELLIRRAEEEGLIEMSDGVITPLFSLSEVEIPLGFKPPAGLLDRADPVQEMIARISAANSRSQSEVVAELNDIASRQFDGRLIPEAAVLILAKRYAVSFDDKYDDLRRSAQEKK